MIFSAEVKVMPLKELLDPQGKAVSDGLKNLGLKNINDVRIGKHINLQIEAATKQEASAIAEETAKKLLANPVMEEYEIQIFYMCKYANDWMCRSANVQMFDWNLHIFSFAYLLICTYALSRSFSNR